MSATILVVEDDPQVQALIAINLQHAGYQVQRAGSVPHAEAQLKQTLPDLAVLDWMLPETLGMTFARRLRADQRTRDIPIIMLSARAQESDKLAGLEAGVDDYVTKPFSTRELLARIKAVIRRCSPQLTSDVVEIAGLNIDPGARRVTCCGRDIEIGAIEFRMLHFFMTHPERVYSRTQLLDEVWGDQVYVEERTVDVHIRRLRLLLKPAAHEDLLETVRGVGYRFRRNLPHAAHGRRYGFSAAYGEALAAA
jgi:two-component system phosphate regulon response regulator PhoB